MAGVALNLAVLLVHVHGEAFKKHHDDVDYYNSYDFDSAQWSRCQLRVA